MASRRLAFVVFPLLVGLLAACGRPATVPSPVAARVTAADRQVKSELLAMGGPEAGRPVLLVHGRKGSRDNYSALAPALAAAGFSVYGIELTPSECDPSEMVAPLVRTVRLLVDRHGPIDVVAHSMGGLVVRAALKQDPSLRVGTVVMLAVPNHGTQFARFEHDPAALAMRPGSAFLKALDEGDETPGMAHYVSLYSKNDNCVFPYWRAKLHGAVNLGLWGPTHGEMAKAERPVRLAVEFLKTPASASVPSDLEE